MQQRRRRSVVPALLVALAATAPPALADKPETPPGQAKQCSKGHRFCAGAATADITPPVTSPQFAYTFRHCGLAAAEDTGGHAVGAHEHVEEFAYWLAGGGPGCAADKANAELYSKTFPPSEGTYGRLQANAFVLDDGRQRIAMVQADLGGIPGELHTRVAQLTEQQAGVDAAHLLISATHTHGSVGGIFASGGYAALGGDLFDRRVFEAVAQGIATSVVEAAGRLRPAKLAIGSGELPNANGNRRRDAWVLNPEARQGESADATRLTVIRVDTTNGVPLGVVTNFTNHGIIHGTFNQFLSGDNQGQATRQVARAIRAKAAAAGTTFPEGWEVVDALTNGPNGDISPRSDDGGWAWNGYGSIEGAEFRQFARMENGGARQVDAAVRIWEQLGPQLTEDVRLDARMDWVCFCGQDVGNDPHDNYDREQYAPNDAPAPAFHATDPRYFGTSAQPILGADDGSRESSTLYPGHHLKRARLISGPTVSPEAARVQLLRVNDVAFATMPGEPTIQMGRRIERSVVAASGGLVNHAVLVGMANDYVSYMATTQEYEAYRYEGGFSLWGQQTGNLFKERLVWLAGLMRTAAPVPACARERGCVRSEPAPPPVDVAPPRLLPDANAGVPVAQPASGERFGGRRFTWYGGSPGAEWSPDDALVELQHEQGDGTWRTVASDLDPEVPVRYQKRGPLHTWTAYVDPTKDVAVGRYRLLVTGHAGTTGGGRTAYTLASQPFDVTPSTALTLARRADGQYEVVHPAPDGLRNFRYRERVSQTATVLGSHGPAFPLAPGTVVPAGAVRDAWGNTNGTPIVIG